LSKTPATLSDRRGGRIYQQTFIDTYAKVAFAKLYDIAIQPTSRE
jgi:hypothetical protein